MMQYTKKVPNKIFFYLGGGYKDSVDRINRSD